MTAENPFTTAAQTWLEYLKQKRKLSKHARQAVLSFGMWLDKLTEERKKEHETEN